MAEHIRLGFIGCGGHSTGSLYPNLPFIDTIDLVATCDLIGEKAQRNARNFGAKSWYTDYEQMIASEELDAVAIVGSPQMHTELGIACLKAGLHIFIEKPPSVNAANALRLVEAARKNGKMGMVATMWRHTEAHQIAKKLMGQDDFGEPIHFYGKFHAPGPRGAGHGADNVIQTYLHGQGVHLVDCMRFFMGDVAKLYASIIDTPDGCTSHSITLGRVDELRKHNIYRNYMDEY